MAASPRTSSGNASAKGSTTNELRVDALNVTAEEEQHWRDRDPIDRMRAYLVAEGLWDDAAQASLDAEAAALGERVRTYVKGLGRPAASSMFDHVYATDHSLVTRESAWFADYEASFAETQGGHR